MQSKRPIAAQRMSERELEIHKESNRIAHLLFKQFYAELKNTSLQRLNASEAMALTVDCCAMMASQAIGTIFSTVKNELSDFVTSNLIIETENRAFKKNFESFIRLQGLDIKK